MRCYRACPRNDSLSAFALSLATVSCRSNEYAESLSNNQIIAQTLFLLLKACYALLSLALQFSKINFGFD